MPKIMCYAPLGGTANLRAIDQSVLGGAGNLSNLEFEQYKRAKLMAAPANGGDLAKAKAYLEEQGWTVLWDGPASEATGNDDKYFLRLPADLKTWVQENGGASMVRALLQAARERQEAETAQE